jgi:hypothetical protein
MVQLLNGEIMKKFAVLNPLDGTYTYTDTETERDKLVAKFAFDLYRNHVHDAPYSIVEVAEDGSEKWFTISGEVIFNPTLDFDDLFQEMLKNQQKLEPVA